MNPTVGTVWLTAIGVTHRSPTRCSTSSTSVRYFTTGTSACGILEKSGQRMLLNTPQRRVSTTGAIPVIVTAAPVSQKPSVSARYASPAKWSRCEWEISACSIASCSETVSAPLTVSEQLAIEHALISHSHLDHFAGLAYLAETLGFCETGAAVTITGIAPVVDTLRWGVFNNILWPDFSKIPHADVPVVKYRTLVEDVEQR